jgi:5-methylcytosine-specific restriction endonuclease McrA
LIEYDPATGFPICIRGHVRESGRRNCRECERAASLRWINRDRLRARQLQRERRQERGDEYRGKKREQQRSAYEKNPDQVNNRTKRYRARNPDKARKQRQQWAAANHERVRESAAKSRVKNREARLAAVRNRRAKQRNAGGRHTAKDIAAISEMQGHKCAYCRISFRKAKRHVDHILPIALGGANDRSNLQLLCAPCNLSKQAKHPVDFAQSRGLLL